MGMPLRFFMLLLLVTGSVTLARADETTADSDANTAIVPHRPQAPESAPAARQQQRSVKVEFDLVDRNGNHVTQENFRGKFVLLTFGYTHCEHICPTILEEISRTLKASGNDMAGIFISVDTERDSPAITDGYASGFSQKITGLSGSYADVAAAANNFNVRYSVTITQNHYMVQHSSHIFYIGPDGKLINIYTFNSLPHELAK